MNTKRRSSLRRAIKKLAVVRKELDVLATAEQGAIANMPDRELSDRVREMIDASDYLVGAWSDVDDAIHKINTAISRVEAGQRSSE